MSSKEIQLNPSSIIKVHLETYEQDFTFIVNGKEYKTSRIISDILSSKINEIHLTDSSFNIFHINTHHEGDFSHILKLCEFKSIEIEDQEIPFYSEIFEILKPTSIEIKFQNKKQEINNSNVIQLLKTHEQFKIFYFKEIEEEISFCASHFFEIATNNKEELKSLEIDTIINIISHEKLRLRDEDQLLEIGNEIYIEKNCNTDIYENVEFENVSIKKITEFINIFDINDITNKTWQKLCLRLGSEITKNNDNNNNSNNLSRYDTKKEMKQHIETKPKIEFDKSNTMNGIIKYLANESKGNIDNEINITSSSVFNSSECYQPRNVSLFDDQTKYFLSNNSSNEWICFEFKNHRVIPTGYTIRTSINNVANGHQPKSWCIEGSNDKNEWQTLSTEKDSNYMKGTDSPRIHTFTINNQNSNEFKFIRMKLTDKNWGNSYYFFIDSFEIYGNLI